MKLRFFRVTGDSMSPGFRHDDYVLAFARRYAKYKIGDVVVLSHESLGTIIKRIKQLNQSQVLLQGDNPASIDSQTMGWQSTDDILGKVLFKFAAPIAH